MHTTHRGASERQRTFPRGAFLAYHSLIARESMELPEGVDPEEMLTWEQWESER